MFDRIIYKMVRPVITAGLEVIILPDAAVEYRLVILNKGKKEIQMDLKADGIADLEEVIDLIPVNVPVNISFNGKGILHKIVNELPSGDITALVPSLLPNAKPTDFHIQAVPLSSGYLVSLARKEAIFSLVEKIRASGRYIIGLELGPFSLVSLLPFLDVHSNHLKVAGHELTLTEDAELSSYQYQPVEGKSRRIFIGKEAVPEQCLIAFALAYQSLTDPVLAPEEEMPLVLNDALEFRHKLFFQKWGVKALLIILGILVINFGFYSYYFDGLNEIRGKQVASSGMIELLDSLEKEVKGKQVFIDSTGWSGTSKMAYFADRVAASVPPEMMLTRMAFNPLDEKLSKERREDVFNPGTINISGFCADPTLLNDWMKTLDAFDWTKEVKVDRYRYDTKNKEGNFIIAIKHQ